MNAQILRRNSRSNIPENRPDVARARSSSGWLALVLGVAAGCGSSVAEVPKLPPPVVTVSRPIEHEVTDYVDFTGRTEAPMSVDIRPRVTGYLIKMPFVEGSEVKAGELLFEIDPRPFQAQVDHAKAEVALSEAALKIAKSDYARAKQLGVKSVAAISVQELETYEAKAEQSAAQLLASRATLESNQINLDFTKVTSPIDGRISRYNLTIGNLVNADTTLLTTVVSQDPMYAYFDADELTLLTVERRLMASNVANPLKAKVFPVLMGLADEEGFPHKGYVDFANNVVSSSTGTITVRGVFPNPAAHEGRRLLRPGMFVRIRLLTSKPHPALLVSERAIGADQGSKFVYVVDAEGLVQYRAIKIGPLQDDGLRVVEEGIKPDDRVVVTGLQLVRPQMKVEVEEQPMVGSPVRAGGASQSMPPKEKPAARSTERSSPAPSGARSHAAAKSAKTAPNSEK